MPSERVFTNNSEERFRTLRRSCRLLCRDEISTGPPSINSDVSQLPFHAMGGEEREYQTRQFPDRRAAEDRRSTTGTLKHGVGV